MKTFYYIIFLTITSFFTLATTKVQAQELLEKRISIRVTNQPLDNVLRQIESLGGFSFSYNPDIIEIKSRVSINVTNQSIREILNDLFKGKVIFKERHKYIILNRNTKKEDETPPNFNLNGYIINKKTGEKLANASIYEPVTLASTISNQYGYYRIRLPTSPASVRLEIRKDQFIGQSVIISNRRNTYLPILLNPDTLKALSFRQLNIVTKSDSINSPKIEIPQFEYISTTYVSPDTIIETDSLRLQNKLRVTYHRVRKDFSSAFASAKQAINTKNITDTLYRPVQSSILPFISTNRELSGNVVNDFSFNIFAGYSLGTNKLEIGGLFNADRGHVKGVQLAGIGNFVGNNVTGFQYASALNVVMGNVIGLQYSTLLNFTGGNFKGVQWAGVGNVMLGELRGWQISGAYNYAKRVKSGHQLSTVNYADSSETTPIGFFSYVRKNGYRRYEVSTDEFNYFNTTFKTGMKAFYNVFTIGFNWKIANKPFGSIGYGFGTAANLGRGWMFNADITANAVAIDKANLKSHNAAGLFRLSTAIEKKTGKRFSIAFGPSLNLLTGNEFGTSYDTRNRLSTFWIGGKPDPGKKNYGWVGFQIAIRFRDKL
ncbi:STN and carboxypeptidase regulatory-like domain-containing protein [Dyadobacter sp. CY356]|uniref:STN and carboxypeptidase regulatory-like domain-containing protein n=1 Tax=Dyadobacter sp. CY356 TaxID=2906442 RepID=UPI001F41921C|nr:STN and carboxypeptidase regulatory-like domain-containing protein [Dyadobacter sp. CY356]MCF0058828.1 STN domain-containing protein [Dyadobacter sp. CY356]